MAGAGKHWHVKEERRATLGEAGEQRGQLVQLQQGTERQVSLWFWPSTPGLWMDTVLPTLLPECVQVQGEGGR